MLFFRATAANRTSNKVQNVSVKRKVCASLAEHKINTLQLKPVAETYFTLAVHVLIPLSLADIQPGISDVTSRFLLM